MLALIAVQEAAVIASGHGSPLSAPIGTGTVDGFAAGMLLSGVVFVLILAQRRALRRPVGVSATRVNATPATPPGPAGEGPAPEPALGLYPAPVLAAPVEAEMFAPIADTGLGADLDLDTDLATDLATAFGEAAPASRAADAEVSPTLSTQPYADPYADVSPFAGVGSLASFRPFGDAANEVVLQAGVRLEEWLEGQMRRPSLPGSSRAHAPAAETASAPATPVSVAVAAAGAATAVVPATLPEADPPPAATAEEELGDEPGQRRRAPAYQSKHRLSGRNDAKPWPENHRRAARHAAASSARSGTMSRMLGLRQLRPVSAAD
jgi:hypothetical protein